MRLLGTIESESVIELNDGMVTFKSKAAIDGDGSGPSLGDPDFQSDTSLKWNGKALNAQVDRYIVVPPLILFGVRGIVLGSQAWVLNLKNGQSSEAVVGDIGPHGKLGEISSALAVAIGINPSPVSGGEEDHVIWYSIKPGFQALVQGKSYQLQAA